MSTPVSQRAYARSRGVTHRAVQKAIATKRIPTTSSGKVDPEAADLAWNSNTDESKVRKGAPETPRLLERPASPPAIRPASTASQNGTATGYQAARALHETYRARTERLKYERLSGTLVPLEDVRLEAFTTARRVREAVLSLPDRLSPVLAAMSEPAEIHLTLLAELRQALEELSRERRT